MPLSNDPFASSNISIFTKNSVIDLKCVCNIFLDLRECKIINSAYTFPINKKFKG